MRHAAGQSADRFQLDGTVVVDKPFAGYRILGFVSDGAAGMAIRIEQFINAAIAAGGVQIAQDLPAFLTHQIFPVLLTHIAVAEPDFIGLQVRHMNDGLDAIQHRQERFMGIPQGGFGAKAIGNVAGQNQYGLFFLQLDDPEAFFDGEQ